MSPFVLLWWLLISATFAVGCSFTGCIPRERDALLNFKLHLIDPSNRLSDWTANGDCCNWTGVVCHNITSHVLQLRLRTLSYGEYSDPDHIYDYEEYEESALGGTVSSSLAELKHLRYLDLSNNHFGGVPIPTFLASMGSLRYLNLSDAGFGGTIPPQLGNLSNLHYLNLRGSYFYGYSVENLDWISGLSSLEFLDLSYANLSKSFDWLKVMNSLPSLVELHLSDCQLPGFNPLINLNFSSLSILDLSWNDFGGTIPPQLGNLSNLHYLNLQGFYDNVEHLEWISGLSSLEFLDLSYVNLNKSFDWLKVMNSLPSLVELHLSDCQLPGFNPLLNLNFSSLSILDLSWNEFGGPIPNVLQNMTSLLRELDLSHNDFNSSIPNWLYGLSHLQTLNLRFNDLRGQISSAIGNLTFLISLGLSYNYGLEFEQEISSSFQNLCSLRSLHLIDVKINNFFEIMSTGCVSDGLELLKLGYGNQSGHLTDHLGHFKNLKFLGLYGDLEESNSKIHGPIPRSLKHLCTLRSLVISGVKLGQEINDVLEILSSGCISYGLQSLALRDCQLSGHLSDSLSQLRNLSSLVLVKNSISGPIPLSLGEMASLKSLHLGINKLNGSLPVSLGRLTKLEELSISYNLLEGEVSELHFANLTKLRFLYASEMGKNIALRVSPNWIPPLQLARLELRSWHIGPQFPLWLHSLQHLEILDLSNSGISSPIPIWFWDNLSSQYYYLNFSHNQMHGSIPNIPSFGSKIIDLSSNNFSGPVPFFSPNLTALDLSNNSFSGSLSNFLCYNKNVVKYMQFLNLRGNLLSGEIPDCWMSWKHLVAIKLSNNKFSGILPNSIGTLSSLESLSLRENNLSGIIPLSLANCTNLIKLDVSDNKLSGNIPIWIGDRFSRLMILILRANKFDGHIPEELCYITSLHILDLANNTFSGTIPSCFCKFIAMATGNDFTDWFSLQSSSTVSFIRTLSFIESTLVVTKGKFMEYSTNILVLVRSIDLSHNNFSGDIPNEITLIAGLQSLNLSQNALGGRIPNDIGAMRSLESLDLSKNQIFGEIPSSISSLTFLNYLNLSNNKLWGRIPTSTQLQSFDSSSFFGNDLCGPPLDNNYTADDPSYLGIEKGREKDYGNETKVVDWFYFYVSIAPGFVVGFWGVVGPLVFNRRWRHLYFQLLIRSYVEQVLGLVSCICCQNFRR